MKPAYNDLSDLLRWAILVWLTITVYASRRAGGQATQPTSQPTDDAPALAAVLATHQPLILTAGRTYNIASKINCSGGPVVIIGNGAIWRTASTLTAANYAGDTLGLNGCSPVYITNLIFDQNRTQRGVGPDTNAIRLANCKGIVLTNLTFRDAPLDALRFCASNPLDATTGCIGGIVTNCRFNGAYRNLVSVISGQSLVFDECLFTNAGTLNATAAPGTGSPGGPGAAIDIEPNVGDAQGTCNNIVVSRFSITNCTWGLCTQNGALFGTHDVTFAAGQVGTGVTYGLGVDCLRGNILLNKAGSGVSAGSGADSCILANNLAKGIYADTWHLVNPQGHWLINNNVPPPGVIDVQYCNGKVILINNKGQVKQ